MEVMIFIIFFSLVFITTFALWKYVRLKHDVYEYTDGKDEPASHKFFPTNHRFHRELFLILRFLTYSL